MTLAVAAPLNDNSLTSREIPPEAACFFRCSFRPEVVIDVISGAVVDPTGVKVRVKFGDSRSNRSRDIRLPNFVRTVTTTPVDRPNDKAAFCLKICHIAAN